MTGLTLIGLDDDGAHLLLADAQGVQYRLPVSDELRRMVRHAMATTRTSVPQSAPESTMSPREIQQRLRAGLTPAELAELSGEPLVAIEKFAAPVLAERQYVIDQARGTRIGREQGAPILEDLVADRLAARRVSIESVTWEAWREADEPWRVAVQFRVDDRSARGVWTYDHTARSLTAEDEESRWLTETELLDAPIPRRHLSAVPLGEAAPANVAPHHPSVASVDRVVSDGAPPSAAIPMPDAAQVSPTEALLEELGARRGTRESVDVDEEPEEDEVFEGFGPAVGQRIAPVGFGGAPADDEEPGQAPATRTAPSTPGGGERRVRKGRASVPSWDEIVFGARPPE